jgi:hypothetical protein
MRNIRRPLGSFLFASLVLVGCGPFYWKNVSDAPPETNPPQPPQELPPTGQVWEEVVVDGDCGKQTLTWVLVDEVCGSTSAEDYLARFRAPMFRDGVVIGTDLYTVDGTNLWALDVTDPGSVPRKSLAAGLGTPISIEAHQGDLVIAAGGEGVLVVDVTDPASPVRVATIELDGPALDVHVDGDRAFAAMGAAGLAVIDLLADPPAVTQTVPIGTFTAGVTVQGDMAYVAACESLSVVDLTQGSVVGQTWLGTDAYAGDFLVAPAKDVEIVDTVAYVAAGRFGSVAIDVSTPEEPKLIGNCTVQDDLKFYASGVRAQNGKLFVAGGEWGVLPVDILEKGCTTYVHPVLPDYTIPGEEGEEQQCDSEPPWSVVDWQEQWAPPAPGKDPIQVLPMDNVLYAFGDARRNALRAVDLKDPNDASLANVGRYQEPRLVTGIAANGNTVVALGEAGGVFVRDDAALLVPVADVPPLPADAVAISVLADGRWVAATAANELLVQGESALTLSGMVWPFGLQTSGNVVAVAQYTGVTVLDLDTGETDKRTTNQTAELPSSLLRDKDGFVVAAPEWTHAVFVGDEGSPQPLADHGVFDEEDILETSLWRRGVPSRMLLGGDAGILEVATLGGRAGLFVHATSGRVELPAGEYRGGAAIGARAYLVAADRAAYRTRLVTVDVGSEVPQVLSVESFIGVGTGTAVDGDRLYVADGDRGIRVYSRTDDAVTLLGVVTAPEVTP